VIGQPTSAQTTESSQSQPEGTAVDTELHEPHPPSSPPPQPEERNESAASGTSAIKKRVHFDVHAATTSDTHSSGDANTTAPTRQDEVANNLQALRRTTERDHVPQALVVAPTNDAENVHPRMPTIPTTTTAALSISTVTTAPTTTTTSTSATTATSHTREQAKERLVKSLSDRYFAVSNEGYIVLGEIGEWRCAARAMAHNRFVLM
jgi:hypothetical protein